MCGSLTLLQLLPAEKISQRYEMRRGAAVSKLTSGLYTEPEVGGAGNLAQLWKPNDAKSKMSHTTKL